MDFLEVIKIINEINSKITFIFKDITEIDNLNIEYVPNIPINEDEYDYDILVTKLKHIYCKYRQREICLGMTVYGPHRDDFIFKIRDNNVKDFGSQGQQKLAVIALKLSLLEIYKNKFGEFPVLLLDDIFSELDRKRKNKLIEYINNAGQVIITTNDIRDINKKKIKNVKLFEIKDKKIVEKGDINGKWK